MFGYTNQTFSCVHSHQIFWLIEPNIGGTIQQYLVKSFDPTKLVAKRPQECHFRPLDPERQHVHIPSRTKVKLRNIRATVPIFTKIQYDIAIF